MIQDLKDKTFNNAYFIKKPENDSIIFIFNGNTIMSTVNNNEVDYPKYKDTCLIDGHYIFIFSIDKTDYFILFTEDNAAKIDGFNYNNVSILRSCKPKDLVFAGITANSLNQWYISNKYCGKCGNLLVRSKKERMLECPECHNNIYPKISPGIIVGIINKDKILLTKYAGREYKNYALVAGFTEFGESLEQTVRREVMEEVGLKVKDITFYKSQPWAYSSTLLCGFFAKLDGNEEITLEEDELAEGKWFTRDEIDAEFEDFSLTNDMIMRFKKGFC